MLVVSHLYQSLAKCLLSLSSPAILVQNVIVMFISYKTANSINEVAGAVKVKYDVITCRKTGKICSNNFRQYQAIFISGIVKLAKIRASKFPSFP